MDEGLGLVASAVCRLCSLVSCTTGDTEAKKRVKKHVMQLFSLFFFLASAPLRRPLVLCVSPQPPLHG